MFQIARFFLHLVRTYGVLAVNWMTGRTAEEVFQGIDEEEEEVRFSHSHRNRMEVDYPSGGGQITP